MPDPGSPAVRPAWHALLVPLPANAVPVRQPVAPPEVLASPTGSAVAGWEQLVLHLSAGDFGSRIVLVVLDDSGAPLCASDAVLYGLDPSGTRTTPPCDAVAGIHQDGVGGRFEPDGEPSHADVAALKALVSEVLRRRPGATP